MCKRTAVMIANSTLLHWLARLVVAGTLADIALLSCGNGSPATGFGNDASPGGSSGSSSGNGSSSGGSSSGGSSTGSSSSSGGSSGGSSSSSSGGSSGSGSSSGAADASAYPLCGTPCDPLSMTCCLPAEGGPSAAYCLDGSTVSCGPGVATFHCEGVADCKSGNLCCGIYDLAAQTAATVCQTGVCAIAQFCKTDAECRNGMPCTAQTCAGGASVHLCGLQSAPPYNCLKQ
jgi:hypothetical protein